MTDPHSIADAKLERRITFSRNEMDAALENVNLHRRIARACAKDMARLIALRSPEQIARMERNLGLA